MLLQLSSNISGNQHRYARTILMCAVAATIGLATPSFAQSASASGAKILAAGTEYLANGEPDKALASFVRVMHLGKLDNKQQVTTLRLIGRALVESGDPATAVGYYNHALWLDKSSGTELSKLQSARANALLASGNYAEAAAGFTAALAINPNNEIDRFGRGVAELKAGFPNDALADLTAIVDSKSDLAPYAKYAAAMAYGINGQFGVGSNLAGQAKSEMPGFSPADSLLQQLNAEDTAGVAQSINDLQSGETYALFDPSSMVAEVDQGVQQSNQNSPKPVFKVEQQPSAVDNVASKQSRTGGGESAKKSTGSDSSTKPTLSAAAASKPLWVQEAEAAARLQRDGNLSATEAHDIITTGIVKLKKSNDADKRVLLTLGHYGDFATALDGWDKLVGAQPELLSGMSPRFSEFVQPLSFGDSRQVVRLEIGPFRSFMPAAALCINLKSSGLACSVRPNKM